MILNNRDMSAETRGYIFRRRSRCPWHRLCFKAGQTIEVMLHRQKPCVVHTDATCSRDVYRGKNYNLRMLRAQVPRICCSDMSPRVNWYFYTCATPIWGIFCPRDVTHEVQRDELCATCLGDKISLLHVPATCRPSVHYTCCCHCNISL